MVTAVPKRLKQMVITEEFKSFKDDQIQKSTTFLDSLKSLKSRNIYKILMRSNKMIKTKVQEKYEEMFGDVKWEDVYNLPRKATKLNKVLHRYLPTNYLLFKYKLNNTNTRTFCSIQVETIEHLLFHCIHVQNFGREFRPWWKNYTSKYLKVTLKNILLGFNSRMYQQNIDCYVLHAKLYLSQQKLITGKPEFLKFKLYVEVQNLL